MKKNKPLPWNKDGTWNYEDYPRNHKHIIYVGEVGLEVWREMMDEAWKANLEGKIESKIKGILEGFSNENNKKC